MKYSEYSQKIKNPEFFLAQKVAKEIYDFMCTPAISQKINETHKINAKSQEVQEIISPKCEEIGLSSEKTGLFSNYATAQLRPDYFVPLNHSGLIMEVERGKTIDNNMDLLNLWKCHICDKAEYLLLVVPIARQKNNGGMTRIYEHVVKRISSFFVEQNYVNVKACFIIGYE